MINPNWKCIDCRHCRPVLKSYFKRIGNHWEPAEHYSDPKMQTNLHKIQCVIISPAKTSEEKTLLNWDFSCSEFQPEDVT